MARLDEGHELTEKKLATLERRIAKLYREAGKELQGTINDYFEQFAERDAEMKALIGTVQNGKEWTEQDYKQWRLNQIARGERYQALRDKIAKRMTDANAVAVAYTNDATPGIYSLNRNFSAYTIEQVAGDVGFDLWDEQTVKRLMVERPDLMPYYPKDRALKRGIDLAYGKKQITASVTSSILQGKSVKGMADDLQKRITTMSRDSAIRTARTAVTGAQNAGRMDSYAAAEKMGIKLKREWVATLDKRTRHSHAMLDGQQAEIDKPFKVDGYEIMYPGDTSAPGYLVYNCRCTLIAAVEGVDTSSAQRRAKNAATGRTETVSNMSYQEWAGWKKETKQIASTTDTATFRATNGLTDEFRAGMAETLANSKHDEVKAIYAKYQGEIDCADNEWNGRAHFDPRAWATRFNEKAAAAGSNYQEPYQVAFHEFGHNIDWLLAGGRTSHFTYASNRAYNGVRLQTVIKDDYKAFKKASGKTRNDEVIAMLRNELSVKDRANISDILEFCTNKSYPLGVGHGVAYHKRTGATECEFFAEVLDSAAANEGSFKQMQRIFPNAVKMVFDIIGGRLK